MKKLILFFFIISFCCLSKGKDIIIDKKINTQVEDINLYIREVIATKADDKYQSLRYGFNAQYCNFNTEDGYKDDNTKYQSCYVSLFIKEWYYFCGKVNRKEYKDKFGDSKKDFVENYKEILDTDIQEVFKDKKNKIKIDCFSNKLKYLSIFSMIYSILLL